MNGDTEPHGLQCLAEETFCLSMRVLRLPWVGSCSDSPAPFALTYPIDYAIIDLGVVSVGRGGQVFLCANFCLQRPVLALSVHWEVHIG